VKLLTEEELAQIDAGNMLPIYKCVVDQSEPLTEEEWAQFDAGNRLPIHRQLFEAIRNYQKAGRNTEASAILLVLEDSVMNQPAGSRALAPQLRALRYTNEVRAALDAGVAPTVAAIQAFQRKKGSRPMTPPTIRRALRDLHAYVPGKPGRPT
jgi:hypothetical protein